MQYQSLHSRVPRWCMYLGLFLLICGSRLWLINGFGNATPYWDEWDTEVKVIKAYAEGTLSPMLFFESQNEHRMAFTQMFVLLLYCANKQWDPILQMVVQLPIYAISILFFVSVVGRYMGNVGRAALTGFATCVGIVPFAWKNTLWGIMSAFYFLILLGIIVIWMCWRYKPLTWRWWLGAFLALASLFTVAGAIFPIAAVTAFLAMRLVCERGKDSKIQLAAVAVLAAIVVFGFAITPLHAADNYVATSFKQFFWALTGILSHPCAGHWACIIIQAPLILLAVIVLLRRVSLDDCSWFLIVAAASFWMQALTVAYKRYGIWDASKYTDFWGMLLLINCSSFYFLWKHLRRPFLVYPFAALWLAACIYGTANQVINLLPPQISAFHSLELEAENNAREYLATGNPTYLRGNIPFETPDAMREMLGSDTIRHILPSNLISSNQPLTPVGQKSPAGGFAETGYPATLPPLDKPAFGSYQKSGGAAKSEITLQFDPPRGAREVNLEIAGYPTARGMTLKIEERRGVSYSLIPIIDPGNNWQTISVSLDRKSTEFKIVAKDQSDGSWFAFSLPTVATGGFPGRWARLLARNFFYFIDLGLVLLVIGGLGSLACAPEPRLENPSA